MKRLLLSVMMLVAVGFFGQSLLAQGIKGTVKDADYHDGLIGATVKVAGTNTGVATDLDGNFELSLKKGTYTIEFSYVGYDSKKITVNVAGGKVNNLGNIYLKASTSLLNAVKISADRAKERETPVAFSNVEKKQIEEQLGSRDIPLVMNVTPSVYATPQGGGSGDARINVRGFNQRNVAVMINGVPVNDMENGWVYWSNWDGIADATSSIQLQRGLSAVNLATPSIGGTLNILTSPAEQKKGGKAKFEYGSGNFMKASFIANTGLINDKFAASVALVRKVGTGIIDATWTDAWAYYASASYNINKNNRIEFYAVGAPQRHGQNLYRQNMFVYDSAFAVNELKNEGYADTVIDAYADAFNYKGRNFNQNWAPVDPSYDGQQWLGSSLSNRHEKDFINTRENFYHKPQVNFNWYSQFSSKLSLFTTLYYSGGVGGGTGTYGKMYRRDADGELGDDDYKFYYGPGPWTYDLNKEIEVNGSDLDTVYVDKKPISRDPKQSIGILRNSRNNQYTYGAIAKLKYNVTDHLKTAVGIDWRTAQIDHYREVRDLLGGEFFVDKSNEFDTDFKKVRGDRVAYNFTNDVNWVGAYAQAEYTSELFSAYATYGFSQIRYNYHNHFRKAEDSDNELAVSTKWMKGSQLKGGFSYMPAQVEGLKLFANFGLISKAPIFDNVIDDRSGVVATDPVNEKFTSYEVGTSYASDDDRLHVTLSAYSTLWADRSKSIGVQLLNDAGNELVDGTIFLTGMTQLHRGVELEGKFSPTQEIQFGASASLGNWEYTKDVFGTYRTYEQDSTGIVAVDDTMKFYTGGLKVGDSPQSQLAFWLTYRPFKGFRFNPVFRYYTNYYADFNPFSRMDENDKSQVWKVPDYYVLDLHFNYDLPLKTNFGVSIFAHVFNTLNATYIQDAVDNSKYNRFSLNNADGVDIMSHSGAAAEVFFGLPRRFNVGVTFKL